MAAKVATKTVNLETQTVSWEFTDGTDLSLSLSDLPAEIVTNLALHGLSQKGGDSYSGETDLQVAVAKVQGVIERLKAGEWRATREGGSGGRISDLAQALAQVTGKSLSDVVAMLEEKTKEEKSALRKHPRVALAINAIKEAKLKEAAAEAGEISL